jgi:hypothetical protein
VPITEALIDSYDRDSNLAYSDLVSSEEFLGSHVLRILTPLGHFSGKDGLSVRDSRGKAKQVTTVNGRTVVIKESSVYSNKGAISLLNNNSKTRNSDHALTQLCRVQVLESSSITFGRPISHVK